MKVYKHITYNPHLQTIAQVIANLNDPTWRLDMVLPVMHECVAVFERDETLDNAETDRIRRHIEHLEPGIEIASAFTVNPVPRDLFTGTPEGPVRLGGIGRISP
jgi:hypothetical protein